MEVRDMIEKTAATTPPPPRKRRRTGKACASCRRRKTRCDGGMPCEACRLGEMGCSYDEPDRRMTSVEYIQSLEKKVEELEELLSKAGIGDSKDASTPPSPTSLQSDKQRQTTSPLQSPSLKSPETAPTTIPVTSGKSSVYASDEDVIETMVGAGEYDAQDSRSYERWRGSFAGLSLLRRMQNLCKDISTTRLNSDSEAVQDDFIHAFDFASEDSNATIPREAFTLLPPREVFDCALDIVMNQACCNMQFLDRSTLEQIANEIYSGNIIGPQFQLRKPFTLLYAVLALGRRFEPASLGDVNTAQSIRGLRYFRASRAMLDPADCQDLISLQALLCMILYTQVSSMMSTCYHYICMAVAVSFQMGLFTEMASKELPEAERLHRRKIFSVLNIMDTYVTTALGLPRTLRDVESEHCLPSPTKPDSVVDAGTYAHAELIQILANAVESNHPVTRPISQKNGFYGVEFHKITATEAQLETWFECLPQEPTDSSTPEGLTQMRSQLLLRLAYAHVQMVLYRPFLHHALKNLPKNTKVSMKAFSCGSSCIKAAMQVVWLAETLEACNLFNEAHWFTTLIVSFTSACLVLFVMSNEGDPTWAETEDAVQRMKGLCYRHSDQNASMQRCYKFLESVHPTEPLPIADGRSPFNAWSREVSNKFSEAYQLHEDVGLEAQDLQGDELVQALSLPQFRTFLNNRI